MRRYSLQQRMLFSLPITLAGLMLAGCPKETTTPPAGTAAKSGGEDKEPGHHHSHGEKGPHGGALVAIGDDAAHLEVVLNAEDGKVTAYVLDGSAQNPIPIKADKLQLEFTKGHSHDHDEDADKKADEDKPKEDKEALPESATLVLLPVSPADDGSTSQFEGVSEDLKGAEEFDAVLVSIGISGKDYTNVKFNYPEGNEHHHHH